jgi:sugar phosphate isomerase/epimerase
MPASPLTDLSRCAIHTMTNKPWSLRQCIDAYTAAGVGGISVWRNVIEPVGTKEAGRMLRASGLRVPALVRGGFFVAADDARRRAAVEVNRRCVEEAHAIGAEMVVLVVGAMPGVPLADARRQVADGIAAVLPDARGAGVKLAIEPLHPMYAADRSCINRAGDARRVCEQLRDPLVGIAFDVYHTWWDPDLRDELRIAGEQGTLFGFHVCDWRVNTRDFLNDRGLMGDGCIDVRTIRGWAEEAGFRGLNEVEVFSNEYWGMDQHAYLAKLRDAFLTRT